MAMTMFAIAFNSLCIFFIVRLVPIIANMPSKALPVAGVFIFGALGNCLLLDHPWPELLWRSALVGLVLVAALLFFLSFRARDLD